MVEGQQPTVSVAEAPGRSGWSTALWVLLALLAHLALLDAAVETFWAVSPLRWWLSPLLIVLAVASICLWRPGGRLLSRFGPSGAAGTAVLSFLAVLAVTAWLPSGQDLGIRALMQSTPRLLNEVLGLAVAVATVVLFVWAGGLRGMPKWVARVVVIALGAYAVLAFVAGVRANLALVDVLKSGGGLPTRLGWLQVTAFGALVLVPLSTIHSLLRLLKCLKERRPSRTPAFRSTALATAVAVALSGVLSPVARPLAGRDWVQAKSQALVAEHRLSTYLLGVDAESDVTVPEFNRALTKGLGALDAIAAKLPRETFDPDAVIRRTGTDPVKIFEWVRENTHFVPYRGVLRGASGVLMDRMGNSLDRSLLLGLLLDKTGHKTRLAHATLSRDEAETALRDAATVRTNGLQEEQGSTDAADSAKTEIARYLQIEPGKLERLRQESSTAFSQVVGRVNERASAQASALLALLGPTSVAPDRDATLSAASDHWWVQVHDGSRWLDLDVTWPKAAVGSSVASPSEVFDQDRVPAPLFHNVRISVIIERLDHSGLHESVALSRDLRPSETLEQTISLVNVPYRFTGAVKLGDLKGWTATVERLAREEQWMPLLNVGSDAYADKAFTTSGEIQDARAALSGAASLAAGIGGMLAGGERARRTAGSLTAEWIEYRITGPGVRERQTRRALFDLVGGERRAAATLGSWVPGEVDSRERGLALLTQTTILSLPCRLSSSYVAWRESQAFTETFRMLADGKLLDSDNVSLLKASTLPAALLELSSSRHEWSQASRDIVLAHANVFSEHRGFSSLDNHRLATFSAFDIVENGVDVRPGSARPAFETRLLQGILDTNVEAALLADCCGQVENAAVAFSPATFAQAARVVRSESELAALPRLSRATRYAVSRELKGGQVAVVGTGEETGGTFWRLDPASGQLLGLASNGWGAATETVLLKAEDLAKIKAARTVFKVINVTLCIMIAAASYAEDFVSPNVPLSTGLKDSAKLAACIAAAGLGVRGHITGNQLAQLGGDVLAAVTALISGAQWVYAKATRKDTDVKIGGNGNEPSSKK
jgi:hypothetical protein